MSNPITLTERFEAGPPVLMDGALSTELSARGLAFNEREWLRVNLDRPEIVADIHASYARAGAELHIANSFATGKHVTEFYGFGEDFEALNRAAVEVCRTAISEAAPHRQWVAGSISTYAANHDRRNLPAAEIMQANCEEQARILADAGCDMIVLEMLFDVNISTAMVKGAVSSGLPVSVGLVCGRSADGAVCMTHRTRGDVLISEALPAILQPIPKSTPLIITIMHTQVDDTPEALDEVRKVWTGKVAAYPHTGKPDGTGGWDTDDGCAVDEFVNAGIEWTRYGVCFVGGCCGIGPAYIGGLAKRLSA